MMETASHRSSGGSGKSRFSKALPAPPPLDQPSSFSKKHPQQLSPTSPRTALEPEPSVPRRDIGGRPESPPQLSPQTSISSLLSAYSDQSTFTQSSLTGTLATDVTSASKDGHGCDSPSSEPPRASPAARNAPSSPITRLPTPGYDEDDVHGSVLSLFLSPESPASPSTSPELPAETRVPGLPGSCASSDVKQIVQRKALGTAPKASLPALPMAGTQSPGWSLAPAPAHGRLEHLEPVSETSSSVSDETVKPSHSVQTKIRVPTLSETTAGKQADEATSDSKPPSAEDGEEKMTDNPGAARFPRNWYQPVAVLDAVPLKEAHFNCSTKHRVVFVSSQRYNPIACATCAKTDREDFWSCSVCHLRICSSCRSDLHRKFRGNLRLLMQELQRQR